MPSWISNIDAEGVPGRALVKLHTAAYAELAITIQELGSPVTMTGKTLTFTARRISDGALLFQKTTGASTVTISGSVVTVNVAKTDVPSTAVDSTDYAFEGVLRETNGALDGKVWAQCAIAIVKQPAVSA